MYVNFLNLKVSLQLFAKHKAGGSGGNTNRSHDSNSQRRGIKMHNDEKAKSGMILYRQLGSKIKAGEGVKMGRDYTLFAVKEGKVNYYKAKNRTFVRIIDSKTE